MKRFFSGLLALCLLCCAPASAAGPVLRWRAAEEGVLLSLENAGERLYALQLELVLEGEYPQAAFTPARSGVYSPDCRAEVRRGETTLTIYLVAEEDDLDAGALGTLVPGSGFSSGALPSRGVLTLLDRSLRPLESESPISLEEGGGHTVFLAKSEHGTLTAQPTEAAAGETVVLTALPEAGYVLDRLTVTDSHSRSVQVEETAPNRRSFIMPDLDVEVNASFVPGSGLPFLDIPSGSWCYDAVQYVYTAGWMNGTTSTTFTPNATTTRGQIVAILYRLEGSPAAASSSFTDVPASAYYASAIAWAAANGIATGYADGSFQPNSPITRAQMAAFLFRYAQYKGQDVSPRADLSSYKDAGQIASYAVEPLRWANALGLIQGTSPTTLTPSGNATRAQAAVILTRFAQTAAF